MSNPNGNPGFVWFFTHSYSYLTTKSFDSKVTFLFGVIPTWIRFSRLFKDAYNNRTIK